MELSAEQIEGIVREVVRRLKSEPDNRTGCDLALSERVVSADLLDGKLHGVSRVRIGSQSVVTPSARDLLNQFGIELLRSE